MKIWKKYKKFVEDHKEDLDIDGRKVYRNSFWAVITVSLVQTTYLTIVGEYNQPLELVYWTGILTYLTSFIYYART